MLLFLALSCTQTSPTDSDPGAANTADTDVGPTNTGTPTTVRFATFNVSLYRDRLGDLVADLADPSLEQGVFIGNIIGSAQPDVLLLNELDYDAAGEAVGLLQSNFFAETYPHVYVAPSNTGVASGLDLDNDGSVSGPEDAYGFGVFEGQYAFAVLSKYPLGTPRTFQNFLWSDLPGAWLPDGWFDDAELAAVRLSSKNHVDLPVQIGGATVHFLVSHPTPPTFDGAEDRNGRRNHDEIDFWRQYLDADAAGWPVDDAGVQGGLDGASFVIAGDLNADPRDGDSSGDPITALLDHPRVQSEPVPSSLGGVEQSALQGDANTGHAGDPANDTTDFADWDVGNLRIDYVLPSLDLPIQDSGVFWPAADDPAFEWVGTFPFPASDHRLVWVDVMVSE